jgi:hypothetical protein
MGPACVLKRLPKNVPSAKEPFLGEGKQVKMDTAACKHGQVILY